MEPIQAVFAIIAFYRAKKYKEAGAALLRLFASILEGLPEADSSAFIAQLTSAVGGAGFTSDPKTGEELCDEVERCCGGGGEGLAAVDWSTILPVVLPLLFELVRKIMEKLLNPTPPTT